MPNAKVLESKKELVGALVEKLKSSAAGVLVDYKGINVENDTKLRSDMRKAGVEYLVVKNTLLRFAANEVGFTEWDGLLHGTTAIAFSTDDAIAPAKIVMQYSRKLGETFNVKGGFVDGKVASVEEVTALADLPSKDELRAKVVGGLNAPIYGLAMVLGANLRGLAVALNGVREKKEASA
ncbi:50S ribosomal protein L10 [Oscillospiraceae bacterium OttesenSCG-928-F05]|nr:50S ribosomal protein L10 [Oscillospiraceae bacterium OttesenSCG-928-F05]